MIAKIGNRLVQTLSPKARPYQVHDSDLRRFFVRVQPSGVMTYGVNIRLPSGRRTQRMKKNYEPQTINRDLARLKAAISKAVEWGIIKEHPLSKVKHYRIDSLKKVRYLDPDEELRLRRSLDRREEKLKEKRRSHSAWRRERGYEAVTSLEEVPFADYLKPMVLLSMNTGVRRGKLFDLQWEDVDFKRKILTVNGERTKSGRSRHIPLNKEALRVLESWRCQTN